MRGSQESTRLIQWGFSAWTAKPLFKAGTRVGTARVQMGSSSEVALVAPRDLAVTVPAGPAERRDRHEDPLPGPGRGADQRRATISPTW